ncbi:hypothetical protein MELB17_16858 [Marinobacter sp. ELB17]|nr:hypothetical protein [Marinobacter sp. ELB17]EBA00052.1 hypothetical protein MELB17_16858 [Marinobacter sp. ELB17]
MTPTERAHVWQHHITDWQATGVSGSAYCKQQSLIYHQFVYWRRKLAPTEALSGLFGEVTLLLFNPGDTTGNRHANSRIGHFFGCQHTYPTIWRQYTDM